MGNMFAPCQNCRELSVQHPNFGVELSVVSQKAFVVGIQRIILPGNHKQSKRTSSPILKGNYFPLNHGLAKTPISENCVNLAESLVDLLNGLGEHLASDSTNFHLKINCQLELINISTFSSFRNWLAVLQKSWMVLSLSTKLSKRWKTSCSLKSHDLHTFRSSLSSSFFSSFFLSLSLSLSSCPLFWSSSSLKYEGHLALYSWKRL